MSVAACRFCVGKSKKPGVPDSRSAAEKEENMKKLLKNFCQDESGQDLIEYTLLMAFVALASASLFISAGGNVSAIWSSANTQLTNAAGQAAS
jgi:Flp pilus assembly pilin Flp